MNPEDMGGNDADSMDERFGLGPLPRAGADGGAGVKTPGPSPDA
jgi:hypothetical protein